MLCSQRTLHGLGYYPSHDMLASPTHAQDLMMGKGQIFRRARSKQEVCWPWRWSSVHAYGLNPIVDPDDPFDEDVLMSVEDREERVLELSRKLMSQQAVEAEINSLIDVTTRQDRDIFEMRGQLQAKENLAAPLSRIAQVQDAIARAQAVVLGLAGILVAIISLPNWLVALQARSREAAAYGLLLSMIAAGLLRAWHTLHAVPAS